MWETVWNCVMGIVGLCFLYELLRILCCEFKRRGTARIAVSNFSRSGKLEDQNRD